MQKGSPKTRCEAAEHMNPEDLSTVSHMSNRSPALNRSLAIGTMGWTNQSPAGNPKDPEVGERNEERWCDSMDPCKPTL